MYKKKQAPIRKAIRKKAKDKRAKQGYCYCFCNHVVFLEGVYCRGVKWHALEKSPDLAYIRPRQ